MSTPAESSKHILVVEDQEIIAMVAGQLLKRAGYQYRHAANGKEALDLLQGGFRPDLILLDVVMPVMDGYQFLDAINADDSLKDIPVIMLTALDNATDVMKAVKRGAVDYCTKPIEPADLLAAVNRLLQPTQ